MNETIRQKALGHLQACNFCKGEMKPIISEDPNVLMAYQCQTCGSIGTLRKEDQDGYCIGWTIPGSKKENNKESYGMCRLLINRTQEQMSELLAEIETENGYNSYARQLCNEALKAQGNKPVF